MQADRTSSAMVTRVLGRTEREVAMLHHDVAELRATVERQAAQLARLKEENARHARDLNLLCAYVQDELARALLWLEAIGGKVLPRAVAFANEFAAKFGQGRTVPPHRLNGRTEAKTE